MHRGSVQHIEGTRIAQASSAATAVRCSTREEKKRDGADSGYTAWLSRLGSVPRLILSGETALCVQVRIMLSTPQFLPAAYEGCHNPNIFLCRGLTCDAVVGQFPNVIPTSIRAGLVA